MFIHAKYIRLKVHEKIRVNKREKKAMMRSYPLTDKKSQGPMYERMLRD